MNPLIEESYLKLDAGVIFVRHSRIREGCPTIVCIHGLGESGLCFAEAFDRLDLARFNLVVPDLLGFGRSSAAGDGNYSFRAQAERVCKALDLLGVTTVTLVGHSMGGDLVTLMAKWQPTRVQALVNVEGSLMTPDDLFISSRAKKADEDGRFEEWFYTTLLQKNVIECWGQNWPSCMRYFASLLFCHPEAFRDSARELVEYNGEAPPDKPRVSEVGKLFLSQRIPKVFCWGTESLDRRALKPAPDIAADRQHPFVGASHWVMVDRPDEFYSFLSAFCEDQAPWLERPGSPPSRPAGSSGG